ncbi:MAG: glycosyltransferase [Nitrosopumilaceae archaeon]
MKKKICIITSSFPSYKNDSVSGGVFLRDFALLLSNENYDVFVLTPSKEGSKNDDERIKVHFFPWIGSEFGLSALDPKNPMHLLRLVNVVISGIYSTVKFIKKNEIELCFAAWAVPSGIFALVAKIFCKTPYSVWALGSDIWKIQNYPFGKFVLKSVLKNAQKLFADGLQLVKDVERISNKKCEFLASSRILDTTARPIAYEKFNSAKINFMFLGRYHQNKGIDMLIEAIGLLSPEEKEKSLFHIFGLGPLEEKIKKMVEELDIKSNTFINNHLDGNEVFSHMSKSDFVVIPSRIESIPVVLSDALQCGKPLVVTNVGDMGTLVKQYKVGFVVKPDPVNIASGLRQAITCDKKQLALFVSEIDSLKNYLSIKKSAKVFTEYISRSS